MNVKKTIAVAISMVLITLTSPLSLTADNSASAETEIWDGTYDTSWYDEEEKELHISTAEELAGLAELVNAGHTMEGQTIYLDNDIYLNDVSDFESWETTAPSNQWTSISNISGTLDGNGHAIYGIYLSRYTTRLYASDTEKNVGFCNTCDGTIQNLNLKMAYITTTQEGWNSRYYINSMFSVGGISGFCTEDGSIRNCVVSGQIRTVSIQSNYYYNGTGDCYLNTAIGGIAGKNEGTISQCANNMTIIGEAQISETHPVCKGRMFSGGICGDGAGSIYECRNSGTITCPSYTGGICGYIGKNCMLYDCYNEGQLSADTTGGIIGYLYVTSAYSASIKRVYNVGTEMNTDYLTGGIVGSHNGSSIKEKAYYLNTTSLSGAVTPIGETLSEGMIAKSDANMKTESFAESLGEAFVYNEGGYPLLAWEVELQQELLMGDVNLDGIFDVADIKLLQDYLVCRETLTVEQGAVADVCTDSILDVFYLCVLKRMYLEQSETA